MISNGWHHNTFNIAMGAISGIEVSDVNDIDNAVNDDDLFN
jgi:hypothetical protein